MKTRFVRVTTKDKLILQGLLYEPEQKTQEVVIHIHGMGGNFYENRFLDSMAEDFTNNGWAFLIVNTRGHDMMADFPVEGEKERYKRIGNAWERFSDCVLDIKAWVNFINTEGFKNIVLQGHSLGAVKVVYYLVKTEDKRIKRLLLASPPDMVKLSQKWEHHSEMLTLAQKMIKDKKGKEILPKQLDNWYYLSAATYVDFSLPENPINIFNIHEPNASSLLGKVDVPVLAFIGTKDYCTVVPAKKGLEILKKKAVNCPKFDTLFIEGATHSYFGHEKEVARLVSNWINKH